MVISKEYKKSIIILSLFFSLVLIFNYYIMKNSFNILKDEYYNAQAVVIGKAYEINQDEISNIVLELKNHNSTYEEKGKEILSEYGYNKDLQLTYIRPLESSFNSIIMTNLFFYFILFLNMVIVIGLFINRNDKRLKKLTSIVEETIEGNFNKNILKYEEGSYGKLAFALEDLRKRLKSNIDMVTAKKEFLVNILSDISHQLKTPIAALKMYNEILEDERLSVDERIMFINNSKIQISRMEWLVQNLLKLAKLDAKAIEFHMESLEISNTIESCIRRLYTKVQEKNIKIEFIKKDIYIDYDKNWISEALINIIKNAIEHSYENGKVNICVEESGLYVKIFIRDFGKGIDKKELPKIFNRFYKSKNNKSKESVGIGLSLAKAIIDGHGGLINVESELYKGTTFEITLLKNI